jgi:protein-tyrosine phosphatase
VQQYSNLEIKTIMNYPIDDLDEKNYAKEIFAATQYLFDMRKNKGLKVFINCKTGISRSPTVAMAFLALYKRVKNW